MTPPHCTISYAGVIWPCATLDRSRASTNDYRVHHRAIQNTPYLQNLRRLKLSIGASESSRRELAFYHGFGEFRQNRLILTGYTPKSLDIDGLHPKIV